MRKPLILSFIAIQIFMISLFLPDTYEIKRSITVNDQLQEIYQIAANTNIWKNLSDESKYLKYIRNSIIDKKATIQHADDFSVVGLSSSTTPKKNILVKNNILLTPRKNQTRIQWVQKEKLNHINRYLSPLIEKYNQQKIEKALLNFKNKVENYNGGNSVLR